jgi:uncharacterized phage protein (TIGR02218 family)
MPEILTITPEYGCTSTYEFQNDIHESKMGADYINARWVQPIAKINFNQAFFNQSVYEYLKDFFLFVEGGEDFFLFTDPNNFYCDKLNSPQQSFNLEVAGVVYSLGDGNYQLCKRWSIGDNEFIKVIKFPKQGTITVYNGDYTAILTPSLDYNTGIATGGGLTAVSKWAGEYYTPVRFENDSVPIELIANDIANDELFYQVPDLRLIEVKFNTAFAGSITSDNNHLFSLSFPINTQVLLKSKTDIYTSDSGYESRDSMDTYIKELQFNYSKANYFEKEYLLGLWLVTLGGYGQFSLQDTDLELNEQYRFTNTISFTTIVQPVNFNLAEPTWGWEDVLFTVDGITLKEQIVLAVKSTYCQGWVITTKDNVTQGFTNHDRSITINGTICSPDLGFSSTSAQRAAELGTTSTELQSVFAQITEIDLLTGIYDNAELVVYIYDWSESSIVTTHFRGSLGAYSIGYLPGRAKQYQIEVQSISEKLNVSVVAQTSSECRHRFLSQGYGRCNKAGTPNNTSDANAVQITASVGSVIDLKTLVISSPATNNWIGFQYGTLTFLTGLLKDTSVNIIETASDTVVLLYELPLLPTVGDQVLLTRSCNKSLAACEGYDNVSNYGGFPSLPGIDNLISGADG